MNDQPSTKETMADSEISIDDSWMFDVTSNGNIYASMCALAMMVGGVLPYLPQYIEIKKTENADGFSLYVCLTLLIANTLRIVFWFGHPFELPLLFQSIIMNLTMLVMIHLCVKVKHRLELAPLKQHYFTENAGDATSTVDQIHLPTITPPPPSPRTIWDFNVKYFWEWSDFLSYLEFLATFTAVVGTIMYFLIDVVIVVELLGYLALSIEAMLAAPQFYKNFRRRSTRGMNRKMVIMWTVGDTFKTCYFIAREAPTQFWVCGLLQVFVDIAILYQLLYYRLRADSFVKEKHKS